MPTTEELTVDANTLALYHLDGTAGSAGKKDNAEGTASRDWTEVGSPASATGIVGTTSNGAYDFNGSSNRNVLSGSVWTGAETAGTVEGWIYMDALPGSEGFIIDFTQGGEGVAIFIDGSGGLKARFRYSGGGGDKNTGTFTISDSTWYYVVATCENPGTGTGYLYVNGEEEASVSLAGCSGNLANNLGALGGAYGGSALVNCKIDEVRVSNIARTPTEIYNYYNDVGDVPNIDTWKPIGEYRNLEKVEVASY